MILVRLKPHNHQIFTEISGYLVDTDAKTLLTQKNKAPKSHKTANSKCTNVENDIKKEAGNKLQAACFVETAAVTVQC